MRRPTKFLVLLAAVMAVACAQPGSADPVTVPGNEVSVEDNRFSPSSIQIEAGETVTWNWTGRHDHNVIGEGFESPTQQAGSFTRTFEQPGSYEYVCTLHGNMKGSVSVVAPDTIP